MAEAHTLLEASRVVPPRLTVTVGSWSWSAEASVGWSGPTRLRTTLPGRCRRTWSIAASTALPSTTSRQSAQTHLVASGAMKRGTKRVPANVFGRFGNPHPRWHPAAAATTIAFPSFCATTPTATRETPLRMQVGDIFIAQCQQHPTLPPSSPLEDFTPPESLAGSTPPLSPRPSPPSPPATHDTLERRSRVELFILPWSQALANEEQELSNALVAMVGGTRPTLSVAQIKFLLLEHFRVGEEDVKVLCFGTHGFLLKFTTRAMADQILHAWSSQYALFRVVFHRWTRQFMASAAQLRFKVLVAIENIPVHAWN